MKQLKKLILGLAISGLAAPALATPTLGQITGDSSLNGYTDTGAGYVSLTDANGYHDTSAAAIILENAGWANQNAFGIFAYQDSSTRLQVFSGADSSSTGSKTIYFNNTDTQASLHMFNADGSCATGANCVNIGKMFGFYLENDTQGVTWFTDSQYNSDGSNHALLFDTFGAPSGTSIGSSAVVVAFDDQPTTGPTDRDFNDLVVGADDVAPVPAPGTLALMGMGLVGLAVSIRRKSTGARKA